MSENISPAPQFWENIVKALNNIRKELERILFPILKFPLPNEHTKVSYNAKYHRITDNRRLAIDLKVSSFGSNEKSYYQKVGCK